MSNLTNLPLEDGFRTSLSQQWTGGTGTVNVASTPNFTFPAGVTTYIVVNPGKSTAQIAEINAYNPTTKTLTVSNITLEKGASISSTAQTHSVGSEVIISDNYQFWLDIQTAINSKIDTLDGQHAVYADDTARDAAIPSPSNGMLVYNTTDGAFNEYIAGAWSIVATGAVVNATETVAGKVELATDAELTAGTDTGGTGASLVAIPSQLQKSINLQSATLTVSDETDLYSFEDVTDSKNKKITKANLRDDLAASTTLKGTVELATDAEALAGTDETRYINSKQLIDNLPVIQGDVVSIARNTSNASGTQVVTHNLGYIPRIIKFDMELDLFPVASGGSVGTYTTNGNKNYCLYRDSQITNHKDIDLTACINYHQSPTVKQEGVVTAVTSTNFTITWTLVGSPTAYAMRILATLI